MLWPHLGRIRPGTVAVQTRIDYFSITGENSLNYLPLIITGNSTEDNVIVSCTIPDVFVLQKTKKISVLGIWWINRFSTNTFYEHNYPTYNI